MKRRSFMKTVALAFAAPLAFVRKVQAKEKPKLDSESVVYGAYMIWCKDPAG
jgi:hypothetical protein